MTASEKQVTQAAMFLRVYAQALCAWRVAVQKQSEEVAVEEFVNRMGREIGRKKFQQLCSTQERRLTLQNCQYRLNEVKEVRAFQYSHYLFLKYLPELQAFKGSVRGMTALIRQANDKMEADLPQ